MFPFFLAIEGPVISAFPLKSGKSLTDVALTQMQTPGEPHGCLPSALPLKALNLELSTSSSSALAQKRPAYHQGISICAPSEGHYPRTNNSEKALGRPELSSGEICLPGHKRNPKKQNQTKTHMGRPPTWGVQEAYTFPAFYSKITIALKKMRAHLHWVWKRIGLRQSSGSLSPLLDP